MAVALLNLTLQQWFEEQPQSCQRTDAALKTSHCLHTTPEAFFFMTCCTHYDYLERIDCGAFVVQSCAFQSQQRPNMTGLLDLGTHNVIERVVEHLDVSSFHSLAGSCRAMRQRLWHDPPALPDLALDEPFDVAWASPVADNDVCRRQRCAFNAALDASVARKLAACTKVAGSSRCTYPHGL